jgi:GT2 family glycosyltransferase
VRNPDRPAESVPHASVVIINYNGLRFLADLLESLERQTLSPFHTLLIDNASSDQSITYVRNHFSWVEVLAQNHNLGFARAGNVGMAHLRSEFVALLNTDMKVEPSWLEELVKPALGNPEVAAVASKLRLYSNPTRLNGVGGAMNYLGYTWDRGMFELDEGQYDQPAEVLFASAGAGLFRRSIFLDTGGFDERFFMYHEDVDFGWRLWLLGFRVITAPRAVAYHHFGGSTRQEQGLAWRELIGERNNIRALLKNYEPGNLARALRGLVRLRQNRRRKLAQLRNFAWNLRYLAETLAYRREVQSRRARKDAAIQHLIVQSPHVPIRL